MYTGPKSSAIITAPGEKCGLGRERGANARSLGCQRVIAGVRADAREVHILWTVDGAHVYVSMWHLQPGDQQPDLGRSIYRLLCPGDGTRHPHQPHHNVVVEIDPVIHLGPWYHQGVTRADPGGPGRTRADPGVVVQST